MTDASPRIERDGRKTVSTDETANPTVVADALTDPRGERFRQLCTAILVLGGVVLDRPVLLYVATVLLVVAVGSKWRFDPYETLWREVLIPRIAGYPPEPAPANAYRFAQLVHAVGLGLTTVVLLAGVTLLGYVLGGLIAVVAGVGALTGRCVGCLLYRRVRFARELELV